MFGEQRAKKPLSPVMRQYQTAKSAYPDAILLFRLGDFYEMFHDDAVVAAQALELTLTSRNKGAEDQVPMAGVPYHAAGSYIAKLLGLGHKVAICEQLGDPSKTRGIVPREVVKVLTPGLITDVEQLDRGQNHFLCAIDRASPTAPIGLALLDLSTAEILAARIEDEATLLSELARTMPREVLVGDGRADLADLVRTIVRAAPTRMDEPLAEEEADRTLTLVLGEAYASDSRTTVAPEARRAAARALRFAKQCNPAADLPVRRIAVWDPSNSLRIDEVTQNHLELVRAVDGEKEGSLLSVLEPPCTPAGTRWLRRWILAPLLDVASIRRRLDAVEAFVANPLTRTELRSKLADVGDLERLGVRAALGEATPRDLGALRDGLLAAPEAICIVAGLADAAAREALGVDSEPADPVADLAELLKSALVDRPPPHARDGGIFRPGYDAALDEARNLKEKGTELVLELESALRQSSGIPSLKVRYTRVFGWYIEVTKAHAAKVPKAFRRKQTVAGAERFTNDELDDLEDRIAHAEERFSGREVELYAALVRQAGANADRLRRLASRLAQWDVCAALAETAHRRDYVRPEVDASTALEIEDGRHPVVEQLAAAGRFVPNDVALDADGERLWLVTGPNMAGKSTLMRQVALIVILAQAGSYVPAKRARIGVVDRVLSRVGASDNVARGESTFMVEMRETANILRNATRRSLVVLDEIGRGTSTYDGLAIAWAVAEHMHDIVRCRALFATHYHELTELVTTRTHAANYSVSARELDHDVVFFHKLAKGPASRSYGVAVARLAGLPQVVLTRAKSILALLEAGAALPSGKHATMRARSRSGSTQLDLFEQPNALLSSAVADAKPHPVVELVKGVDVDRLTPLEALTFVAKLKSTVEGS